jgi:DNA-binding IclR family transcriptional regulator
VFDVSGQLVLALTAIGPTAVFDGRPAGGVSKTLREAARGLSRRLGAPAGEV